MSPDEHLAAARRQIAEAEATVLQVLASARAVLSTVEEENRELHRLATEQQQRIDFYTEREVAQLLKVSESTISRLRKAGKLKYLKIGTQFRYTAAHLAQVGEVVATRDQGRPRRTDLKLAGRN